jgi:hypothetical protein
MPKDDVSTSSRDRSAFGFKSALAQHRDNSRNKGEKNKETTGPEFIPNQGNRLKVFP